MTMHDVAGIASPERPESDDLNAEYEAQVLRANANELREAVIGRRIVAVEAREFDSGFIRIPTFTSLQLTLDDGRTACVSASDDGIAFTTVETFLHHADRIDHAITGVRTNEDGTAWYVYADMGDVLELTLDYSTGEKYYYSFGFWISVF